jgi:methionyl-tRNA formyltransferase
MFISWGDAPGYYISRLQRCKIKEVMRIVFMGTPESAVVSLERLLKDGHEVVAVWTQPDKPAGRGDKIHSPPVKEFALAHGLNIEQPAKIKTGEAKELFASYKADVTVVVAYGRILPAEYLTAARMGCINLHFSLLPRYRGAAPVNWAIVRGEEKTGVTTMFIEKELDSGPILLQRETSIGETETAPLLMQRLATMGADLLSETLTQLDEITPNRQDDSEATFAPLLTKGDGRIDWSGSAAGIERSVRGFQPWPNAYTYYQTRRLIIWRAEVEKTIHEGEPGSVVAAHGDDLIVKCGEDTSLRLFELQPEAKRRMSAKDFINGTHLTIGDRFGEV